MSFLRAFVTILFLSLAASPAYAFFDAILRKDEKKQEAPVYEQSLQEQYKSCTILARQHPAETFKRAKAWYQESNTLAAQHCMALALFEMRDYAGSANELEALLLKLKAKDQPDLWLSMKEQVAKAHAYNKRDDLAEKHLTEALKTANIMGGKEKQMVPMLMHRGRIYAMNAEFLRAIHDLDHAYSLTNNPAVMLERARVFVQMEKYDSALEDVQSVLEKEPLNDEASKLLSIIEKRAASKR